ncbi:RICIN domain-containing protein [Nonomuraea zeae]|uniref:Ricin B lectin domain-containing protein n=1 Tax=Nonomuraea zeae TaxID=1642303 RepID=A0A5S4GHD6_9ACTN|nr:hypothetical protein [Nonomuraea zeae]TMR32385.1 hypothetical protein ETD85_23000 [Nonomuraea zeae]
MSSKSTRRPMAMAIAVGALAAVASLAAAPAEAAAPVTGPPVQMIPQNVPQLPPGQGQLVLAAVGTSPGDKVRLEKDLGLRSQRWRFRFNGGSVAQIVNDDSGLCMRGGLDGNVIRLAVCPDFNDLDPSVPELRTFWNDRQRVLNGVVVHRLENVQNTLELTVRDGGAAVGTLLESKPLNGLTNQLFRLKS